MLDLSRPLVCAGDAVSIDVRRTEAKLWRASATLNGAHTSVMNGTRETVLDRTFELVHRCHRAGASIVMNIEED